MSKKNTFFKKKYRHNFFNKFYKRDHYAHNPFFTTIFFETFLRFSKMDKNKCPKMKIENTFWKNLCNFLKKNKKNIIFINFCKIIMIIYAFKFILII